MEAFGEKSRDAVAVPYVLDDDEVDDLLEFEPVMTAFEKSMSRKCRKGRIFGQRGKFGSTRDAVSESFRSKRKSLNKSSASVREALDHESGILADESSPEFFRRGYALSEENVCTFGSSVRVPPNLFGNLSHHDDLTTNPSHWRTASSTAHHRTQPETLHTRSCSALPLAALQQRPGRRSIQRSHSMALGSSNGFFPRCAMTPDFWEENADPNSNNTDDLDAIAAKNDSHHGRKRIRARRHSMCSSALTPSTATRSLSNSSSLTSSNLPSDLNWLASEESISRTIDLGTCLQDSQASTSPAAQSVASSRKRGVCGSPISDQDDWLTLSSSSVSDARRKRSQSRVFSPLPGEQLPTAPSLARKLGEDESIKRKKPDGEYGGRGDAMDMDDDSDDEQSVPNSSPDSSFEIMNVVTVKTAAHIPEEYGTSKMNRVFDTMSSYEDLKFLINELRQQSQRHCSAVFGGTDIWKVAPPVTQWTSQRRAAFTAWTKAHLGFTVRSAGMGITYVQISKARGTQILETLEAALVADQQLELKSRPMVKVAPPTLFTTVGAGGTISLGTSTASSGSLLTSATDPHVAIFSDFSPKDTYTYDCTVDLANKVASLSMNESKRTERSLHSMIRQVTLPPEEENKINDANFRLSIESIVEAKSSRPSMDSLAHATDLNLHLYGNSPRIGLGRPPKTSFGSICSTDNTHGVRSSTPSVDHTSSTCQALHFVTTPIVNQDRGWGSRPINGRDWGTSVVYDETLMGQLISHFETSCGIDGSRDTFGGVCPMPDLPRRSSNLAFDLEVDTLDICGDDDEIELLAKKDAERKNRKRMGNFNKRQRMSLFATATGAKTHLPRQIYPVPTFVEPESEEIEHPAELIAKTENVLSKIFSFFRESELMTTASSVCTKWSDLATDAHANLLLASVQLSGESDTEAAAEKAKTRPILERTWKFLHGRFPWACYLAEGGAKKVYKVHNSAVDQEEALSVMDTSKIDNMQIVANELAVSAMLSSLVRRGICPNFISMRGVFTCAHPPPKSIWGCDKQKDPNGTEFNRDKALRQPKTPKDPAPGRYQYIRMELASEGDAEELIKGQLPNELLPTSVARALLFQIAFSLYAAADKFSVKHYDLKLLNIFVQRIHTDGDLVLRYGLGAHVFALRMPSSHAFLAKLADFGTANVSPASNGLPVTIAHFTTLENTPPDFMILGDDATQGHGHDNFGLGLCMLHLFTGFRPYEEILEDVTCPGNLKKRLCAIWEDESVEGYSVIRSVILDSVVKDEDGHIVEGDPDETFYDTLYRFLVLFGIPKIQFQQKTCPRVWKAISDSLGPIKSTGRTRDGKPVRKKAGTDITQYNRDCKKYSIRAGNNKYIARARHALSSINGGLDLLQRLCAFDPKSRATAMEVLNSTFMEDFREAPGAAATYDSTTVHSFTSFVTQS